MAKDISLSPVQKGNASHRIITSANLPLFLKLNTLIINHKTFFFSFILMVLAVGLR